MRADLFASLVERARGLVAGARPKVGTRFGRGKELLEEWPRAAQAELQAGGDPPARELSGDGGSGDA